MGERLFGIDSNSDCLLLYLNDVDVTGAGGKPLRKSWYFGYFVFTVINSNNADGCTAIVINNKKLDPDLFYAKISKDEMRKKAPETHCTCENCNNVVDIRKQCPCGLVVYCSNQCQVYHWLIHKKICSHRKNKSKV